MRRRNLNFAAEEKSMIFRTAGSAGAALALAALFSGSAFSGSALADGVVNIYTYR